MLAARVKFERPVRTSAKKMPFGGTSHRAASGDLQDVLEKLSPAGRKKFYPENGFGGVLREVAKPNYTASHPQNGARGSREKSISLPNYTESRLSV